MTLRKYWINGITIIAPLKCGTRWLYDRASKSDWVDIHNLREETTDSDYFLYREGKNHFESAILTDYIVNELNWDLTLHNLLNGESNHWSADMWEHIHSGWCYNKFKMVEYTDVCDLIGDWDVDKEVYDFSKTPPFITKEMVLGMVDTESLIRLNKMVDNNNFWLQQILNGNDEILSKRVVNMFEIKSKAAKEEEIKKSQIHYNLQRNLQQKEFWKLKTDYWLQHKEINKLTKMNTVLQNKLDYAETLLGKKVSKLI